MALETLIPLIIPGGLGPPELVVILLIFVLLFGANRIPELARSTGEAMGEFQKGREEVEQELEDMKDEATPDMDDEEFVDTEPVTSDSSTDTEE
jgi:sec-independent protein translocase protein TatA